MILPKRRQLFTDRRSVTSKKALSFSSASVRTHNLIPYSILYYTKILPYVLSRMFYCVSQTLLTVKTKFLTLFAKTD